MWGVRSSSLKGVDSITNRSDERFWQLWQIWDITDGQIERVGHFINTNQSYEAILCLVSLSLAITCYHYPPEYLESNAAPNLSGFIVICKITTSFYLSVRKDVTGPPRSEVVRSKNRIINLFLSLVFSYYHGAATDLNCQISKFGLRKFLSRLI